MSRAPHWREYLSAARENVGNSRPT